ncbi:WD repeat-containing protein 13-like [Oppia nitens]|uniref:WD repeat-containing protein 13-like n=1 Tax=Oppia nitens TaxID=1686743 RepID=UPI0023DB83FB|nr:WD repeat-containing protein 13-like [Oppia nitens]
MIESMNSIEKQNQYKCHIIWQQIIAIDVRYNAFRNANIKILYIKRRNQILREISKQELNSFRKQYIKLRTQLLSQRYGVKWDQSSRNRYVRSNSNSRLTSEDSMESRPSRQLFSVFDPNISNIYDRLIPDFELDSTRNNVMNAFSENYSFSGMHHIFDQHKEAVTSIRFANDDKSLLCCASMDSTLSICQLTPSPATILYILKGHKAGVVDFEWSLSNDLIVSCSLDGTVKLWGAASGYCLRTIEDPYGLPVMACSFHPYNNNMVVTANSKGYLQVLNVSTGIYTKGGMFKSSDEHNCILCLCFDITGQTLWVGDSKGFISSFIFEMKTCRLILFNKVIVVAGCAITSISNRCVSGSTNSDPLLLVNSACNALLLFKVNRSESNLEITQSFSIKHQNRELMIRSSFCPIISNRHGFCVVTGCEDTCVHFFTVEDNYCKSKCVNKLQGHSAPVLDVCFNYDESLLASSDSKGNVIIWKRETF